MNNLTDLPNSVKLETPSFWFFVKAGFGFAVGSIMVFTVFWFIAIGLLGGLLGMARSLGPH